MPALQVKLKRRKESNMNSDNKIIQIVAAALIFFAVLAFIAIIVGLPVMLLWNAILPHVLGVETISFWEACGIFVLFGILFRDFKSSK